MGARHAGVVDIAPGDRRHALIFEQFSWVAVLILAATSLVLLLSQNWRWSILALAAQYLAVFWLTALLWPTGLSAVKLVSGWMAGAVLGASQPSSEQVGDSYSGRSSLIFRLLVSGFVWLMILSAAPVLETILPMPLSVAQGALLLIGMGLMHLGMTTRPLRVLLGLLTTLSGFEILYASVERSVLVAGLMAMITLGLAFVGAYLLAMQSPVMQSPVMQSGETPPSEENLT